MFSNLAKLHMQLVVDTWLICYMQGYVIYSVRKKLKKQYIHLKGKQIEKLKKSGVEVCNIFQSIFL